MGKKKSRKQAGNNNDDGWVEEESGGSVKVEGEQEPRATAVENIRREESEGFISEHEGMMHRGGGGDSDDGGAPRGKKGARQRYAKTLKKLSTDSPKVSEAEEGGMSSGKEGFTSDEEGRGFSETEVEERMAAIQECALYLGINPKVETELLWIAEEALLAPLPDGWSEALDGEGDPYYFNEKTGYTTWEHPMDAYYQDLVKRVKSENEKKEGAGTNESDQDKSQRGDEKGRPARRPGGQSASDESETETDGDYDEHDKAVRECARYLGIHPQSERHLLWIAEEALYAPLPDGWEEGEDNGDPYFHNKETGDTIWEHPMDPYYRDLVIKEREKGDASDDGSARGGFSSAESGTEESRRLRRKRFQRRRDGGSSASESEAAARGKKDDRVLKDVSKPPSVKDDVLFVMKILLPIFLGTFILGVALVVNGARVPPSSLSGGGSFHEELSFLGELSRAIGRFDAASPDYLLQSLALLGDTKAQLRLGLHYRDAIDGFEEDMVKASDWILLAAERGNEEAQRTLGVMYYEGKNVPRDYEHASRWLKMAAKNDDPIAQSIIGFMAMEGIGGKKDEEFAKINLVKAANAGVVRAQVNLGVLLNSEGGGDNQVEALKWFTLAAFTPDREKVGTDVVKEAEKNRLNLRRTLRVDQVEEAEADAHRWRSVHKGLVA